MLITVGDQIGKESNQYKVCCSDYEDGTYTVQEIIKTILKQHKEYTKDSRIIIEFF